MSNYRHTFEFKGPLPKTQPDRGNWGVTSNYRRKIHALVWAKVLEDGVRPVDENGKRRPLEHCRIACVRYGHRQPDHDNLAASFKAHIDGLVKAGILKDDNPKVVSGIKFGYMSAGRHKTTKITITIIEEDANHPNQRRG